MSSPASKKREWKTVSLKKRCNKFRLEQKLLCNMASPKTLGREKGSQAKRSKIWGGQVFVPYDQGLDINTLQRCHIRYSYSNSHPEVILKIFDFEIRSLGTKIKPLTSYFKGPWSSFTLPSHDTFCKASMKASLEIAKHVLR